MIQKCELEFSIVNVMIAVGYDLEVQPYTDVLCVGVGEAYMYVHSKFKNL